MRIDLHTHSNHSDGTLSPAELMVYAKEKGLAAVALTDHDTISGLDEAVRTAEEIGLTFVPGVEIAASYREDIELHILGLGIDWKNETLTSCLAEMKLLRKTRNEQTLKRLSDLGIEIAPEAFAKPLAEISRAHFALQLAERGIVASVADAFSKYLGAGGPAYVKRPLYTPEKIIGVIHESGGLAILAHPTLYQTDDAGLDCLLDTLTKGGAGLDGIEGIYVTYTDAETAKIQRLAKRYQLCLSGGSDYHGSVKPKIEIGTGFGKLFVPYRILEDLQKRGLRVFANR